MKETQYLDLLFKGLSTDNPFALKPINGKAWGANSDELFPKGRLDLKKNFFYNQATNTKGDWESDYQFVQQLTNKYPKAGKYASFHLAEVWGSRQAVVTGSTHALFDDNRITAAVSVCDEQSKGEYLFVKGAITGIQSYIYDNIKSEQSNEGKKVSRRLRGRSFFVAVLGDIIAEQLVDHLGLEQANILFVGGGHFNLLIPASTKKALDAKIWTINSGLLQEFGLKLGLVLASVPVQTQDLKDFGPIFKNADKILQKAKQRRYDGHLSKVFFEEKYIIKSQETIDKEEEEEKKKNPQHKEDKAKKTKAEEEEAKMEQAGRLIPKANFLLEIHGIARQRLLGHNKALHIDALDTALVFINVKKEDEISTILNQIENIEDGAIKLHRLNDTDFLFPKEKRIALSAFPIGYGFRMLGQFAPRETIGEEDILDLSELAAINDDPNDPILKYPKLAAMRLDIDDLGALFKYGLSDQTDLKDTLALSREMQLFFGGYFNKIAKSHHVYIVYSGGDDAFILGSWINVLNFAHKLKQKFSQFTVDNKEMTFSAGIFMANPKYPITRLAKEAGEEESKAKKYRNKEDNHLAKDAIRIFGHSMSWSRFMEMMDFSKDLLEQIGDGNGKIRRSAVQHLLGVIQSAHKAKDQEFDKNLSPKAQKEAVKEAIHFEFYRHLGRLHALITRRGISDNQTIKKLLQEMSDFEVFQDYLLPLHYVLYKTR